MSFSISGQRLNLLSLQTVGAGQEPVSWLFAIDVSGSVQSAKMDLLRQTLGAFTETMGQQDNAAFLLFGDDTQATPFLSDKNEMQAFIAGLETQDENTNLYKAIATAVRITQTDAAVHAKRCIVVFSDGEDDIAEGFTREEAEQAVAGGHIPVFTVALQSQNPSGTAQESAKVLAGFSRKSPGGVSHTLQPGGAAPADIAGAVAESAHGGYIARLDLTEIRLPQDQALLEIHLSAGGQNAADALIINGAELRAYVPQTPTPSPEPEITHTPETAPAEKPAANWLIFAAGGGAVLLIAAGMLVFALRARKKPASTAPELSAPAGSVEEKYAQAAPLLPPGPRWRFTFTKLGTSEREKYTFDMGGELVLGKTEGQFTIPGDTRLSPRHCGIYRREGFFYVEDLQSTNGTYLNGVPVAGPQRLEQDSILLAGSMELRVVWEEV